LTGNKLRADRREIDRRPATVPLGPDPGVIASMGLFKGLDHEAMADVVRRARTWRK